MLTIETIHGTVYKFYYALKEIQYTNLVGPQHLVYKNLFS